MLKKIDNPQLLTTKFLARCDYPKCEQAVATESFWSREDLEWAFPRFQSLGWIIEPVMYAEPVSGYQIDLDRRLGRRWVVKCPTHGPSDQHTMRALAREATREAAQNHALSVMERLLPNLPLVEEKPELPPGVEKLPVRQMGKAQGMARPWKVV